MIVAADDVPAVNASDDDSPAANIGVIERICVAFEHVRLPQFCPPKKLMCRPCVCKVLAVGTHQPQKEASAALAIPWPELQKAALLTKVRACATNVFLEATQ